MQIEIVETLYGMISFGVMPEAKKEESCVYCDTAKMFYLYSYNGKIYNGKILSVLHRSKETRFPKLGAGDVLTLFVDNKERTVVWYVNSRYAGSEDIREIEGEVYPFVEMTTRGDEVRIVQ